MIAMLSKLAAMRHVACLKARSVCGVQCRLCDMQEPHALLTRGRVSFLLQGKAAIDVVGAQSGKSLGSVLQQGLLIATGGVMAGGRSSLCSMLRAGCVMPLLLPLLPAHQPRQLYL